MGLLVNATLFTINRTLSERGIDPSAETQAIGTNPFRRSRRRGSRFGQSAIDPKPEIPSPEVDPAAQTVADAPATVDALAPETSARNLNQAYTDYKMNASNFNQSGKDLAKSLHYWRRRVAKSRQRSPEQVRKASQISKGLHGVMLALYHGQKRVSNSIQRLNAAKRGEMQTNNIIRRRPAIVEVVVRSRLPLNRRIK